MELVFKGKGIMTSRWNGQCVRAVVGAVLLLVPLLAACSVGSSPTATPVPNTPAPATPTGGSTITLPTGTDVKIDSAFFDIATAYQQGGQPAAEKKAKDIGLLTENRDLRLTLVLVDTNRQPVIDKVKAMGGKIVGEAENLIDILFPLDIALSYTNGGKNFVQDLAGLSSVKEVKVTPQPSNEGFDFPPGATLDEIQPYIAQMVVEGVASSGADKWQEAGIKGKGIKIGIIDAGFKGYTSLLGKELPQKVNFKTFRSDNGEGTDVHGTAVAEIVAAMAPEAEIYLCPINTDTGYINAVKYLVDEVKVQVIQQSQGWHDTRGDGSGTRAKYVNYAREKGVLYVKSAGNEGDTHYTATFAPNASGRHQFSSGKDRLEIDPYASYILLHLTWDAWDNNAVNYDLHLFDQNGTRVAKSVNAQTGDKPPYESVYFDDIIKGQKYYAVIESVGQQRAVRLDLFGKNTGLEPRVPGITPVSSISNPGDATGSFTVGALNYKTGTLDDYSSQGPTLDGRRKPDISGFAGVTTTAYKGSPFHGTSAACPHVSGAAALVFSAQPGATAAQVQAFLEKNAQDISDAGPESKTGYGRLALGPVDLARTPVQTAGGQTGVPTSSPTGSPVGTTPGPIGPAIADPFIGPTTGLPNGGEGNYVGGRYVLTPSAANRAAWSTYGGNYTNGTIEATVQFLSTSPGAAGLVFWQSSSEDYYFFGITTDGFYGLARYQRGQWTNIVPWTKGNVVANGPNTLQALITAQQVTLSLNGQGLGPTPLGAPGSGRVGMLTAAFSQPGVSSAYTNFKMTPAP